MSYAYDLSHLLSELKKKDEQIERMAPKSLTAAELSLAAGAIREVHIPERPTSEMDPVAVSALTKIELAFNDIRRRDDDLVASLTEEERQVIRDLRAKRRGE